ncbi:MAG: aminoacetone oxidase family FAD-binding enzyme, partial [Eubacteriales bacterium]|nr:aminoacetone oxidase family FAD-binding enzyme [Eubacteriales bacterium]
MSRVAVIGGGPAGMLCAAFAARNGHDVTLLEKNEKLGKKLYLTGKGRCNLTNASDTEDFFAHIPRNGKFLYSALYGFDNQAIIALVESMGVPTKRERGNRVFPVSDKSSDVIRALEKNLRQSGATVRFNADVRDLKKEGAAFVLTVDGQAEAYDAVALATGGKSYASTGSTGDGYGFAERFGHTIVSPVPSLVPLETVEEWPKELMGLSLRNVTLSAYRDKKKLYEELGEMLFTHFGVTGPLVLSAVSRFAEAPAGVRLVIDLKPGLSEEELDKRLL